jgi:hypothetical protein
VSKRRSKAWRDARTRRRRLKWAVEELSWDSQNPALIERLRLAAAPFRKAVVWFGTPMRAETEVTLYNPNS